MVTGVFCRGRFVVRFDPHNFTYLAGLPIWKCGEKRFVFVIFPESLGANPWPTDLPSFNTMDCSLMGLYDDRPTSLLECLDEDEELVPELLLLKE